MNKKRLLDKLDKATDRGTQLAISRGYPIQLSKTTTLVGNAYIEKNNKGLYNILSATKTMLYEDISIFDIAVVIAQRYTSNEPSIIKKILTFEESFIKYHTDMIHYLNCLKGARFKHDLERMAILEDKFQVAETFAKKARDSILNFKRVR